MEDKFLRIQIYSNQPAGRLILRQEIQRYSDGHQLRWCVESLDYCNLVYRSASSSGRVVHVYGFNTSRMLLEIKRLPQPDAVFGMGYGSDDFRFDDAEAGAEAARHLLEIGWRRAAIWPPKNADNPVRHLRDSGFRTVFQSAGGEVITVDRQVENGEDSNRDSHLRPLMELPAKCAFFAYDPDLAIWLLDALRLVGRQVPEEIGLICCAHTEPDTSAEPLISYVRLPWQIIGSQMALAIDRWANTGERLPPLPLHPIGVAVRASTARSLPADPLLRRTLKLIDRHLAEKIDAHRLAQHLGVSHDTLERRCRAAGLATPKRLIDEHRMRATEALLAEDPNMTVREIARRCGWCSSSHLGTAFRRCHNCSPVVWRQGIRPNTERERDTL